MELNSTIVTIVIMAALVFATRITGYIIGLRMRDIGRLQPVLEALPGCAMMALIAPAATQGSLIDLIALGTTVLIMWKTNSVVLATALGLGILLLSGTFEIPIPAKW